MKLVFTSGSFQFWHDSPKVGKRPVENYSLAWLGLTPVRFVLAFHRVEESNSDLHMSLKQVLSCNAIRHLKLVTFQEYLCLH